jgi:hypothetical protein
VVKNSHFSGGTGLAENRGARGWSILVGRDSVEPHFERSEASQASILPMNWSADFQIGVLEKPGMIAPIGKSTLYCAFRGSMREIFRGNLSPSLSGNARYARASFVGSYGSTESRPTAGSTARPKPYHCRRVLGKCYEEIAP